ncbi:hypothetical transcript [Echinococcus multilocularis]|uniref:Hypothetical transcript n=1 Tax=Echinococcus multilocularis TaxID=6211 RepID=U6HS42_ECHMU|nr:hypothetical protein EmuJ_000527900 [Echinococcus multilocularis]CDS37992.1 hypothetical transcript [Echinococcus multilocularis]
MIVSHVLLISVHIHELFMQKSEQPACQLITSSTKPNDKAVRNKKLEEVIAAMSENMEKIQGNIGSVAIGAPLFHSLALCSPSGVQIWLFLTPMHVVVMQCPSASRKGGVIPQNEGGILHHPVVTSKPLLPPGHQWEHSKCMTSQCYSTDSLNKQCVDRDANDLCVDSLLQS